jgi:hypothetical protein
MIRIVKKDVVQNISHDFAKNNREMIKLIDFCNRFISRKIFTVSCY